MLVLMGDDDDQDGGAPNGKGPGHEVDYGGGSGAGYGGGSNGVPATRALPASAGPNGTNGAGATPPGCASPYHPESHLPPPVMQVPFDRAPGGGRNYHNTDWPIWGRLDAVSMTRTASGSRACPFRASA